MIEIQRQILDILERLERLEKPDTGGAVETWTPTYVGSATEGTTTYTTQEGWAIRIGPLVIVTASLTWTNATGTGNVRLGGLPYTPTTGMRFAYTQQAINITFANGSIEGSLTGGSTQAQLASPATNAAGTELAIEVAGTLRFTIVYFTSG